MFGKFVNSMNNAFGNTGNKNSKMEISTPYDAVHVTHVGFNLGTGEFTVSF